MSRTEALDALIAEVKSYSALAPNWDGYSGKPACEKAVAFAVGLLERLKERDAIPIPRMSPISTGVMLHFSNSYYVEIDEESVLGRDGYEDRAFDVTAAIARLAECVVPSKRPGE